MDDPMHYLVNPFSLNQLFTNSILDPNFKINDSFTMNFQLQTFAHDGLILWIGDPVTESSFTIEIQNRQVLS